MGASGNDLKQKAMDSAGSANAKGSVNNPINMPGPVPKVSNNPLDGMLDMSLYRVRLGRFDLAELSEIMQAENIMTQGMQENDNIIIIETDSQAFQESYWKIITYLEKKVPTPTKKAEDK